MGLWEQTDKIKPLLESGTSLFPGEELIRDELVSLYEQRKFKAAWETDRKSHRQELNSFVDSVQAFIAYHGLIEPDEPVATIKTLIASDKEEDAPKLELLISGWLLQIAHEMHGDTINLAHLYPGWLFEKPPEDFAVGLASAIKDNEVSAFFSSLAPQTLAYAQLASALQTYRAMEENHGAWPKVSPGPTIRPGMTDPRLQQVRSRLAAENYSFAEAKEDQDPSFYDLAFQDVVIAYQSRNGLEADGNIGSKTLAALNVPLAKRITQIRANMERMRHMPDEMPERYARVNIADASIKVIDKDETLYHAVVIVGSPSRKTPFIQSKIRSIIFNPAWHVPARIAREDILPKLQKDPHYLEKMGFVINGSADDPHGAAIDWNTIKASEFNFRLRQSPGELNSLGRVKFDFDNDFAVYLHDTSHPELFDEAYRFRSSGCVRIKDPVLLAHLILSYAFDGWSTEDVEAVIGTDKTRWVKVQEPLPLFILYETVFFPTTESLIHFRKDVYNYDQFLVDSLTDKMKRARTEATN